MSLWEWALEVYQKPDVAEASLALQDRHGQSVAFLLWAIWGAPDATALERGSAVARRWEAAVLQPLRVSRNALANPDPPVDDTTRLELREEVISAELLAERVLLETLEGLGPRSKGEALESLTAACGVWGGSPPRDALQRLADAVSAI